MAGIFDKINSPNFLLSPTISRSPWYMAIFKLVCPSTLVVYCLPTSCGTLLFLGIIVSIKPPAISIPKLNGVTSNSNKSFRLPAKISASMAAPKATTSSGFNWLCTWSFLKKAFTALITAGTRVLPPTMTISLISARLTSASFTAILQHSMVRNTILEIAELNSSIVYLNWCFLPSISNSQSTSLIVDNCFLTCSACKRMD